jgi:SAM-dependent methyltransferase
MTPDPTSRSTLVTRVRRALSLVPWRLVRKDRLYRPTHDRYLLEEVIFPALRSRADVQQILFVGCDTYTARYPALFSDRSFTTMDVEPSKARYGAARHVVDTVVNLSSHFGPETLDALICNGVIGWGLDRREEIDEAMRQAFASLRPGGILIVGWNDMPPWRPEPLEKLPGLRLFEPLTLSPFPAASYPTLGTMRHVFNFYVRPVTNRD